MSTFTAAYSRLYQSQQDCSCDSDHNLCLMNSIFAYDPLSIGSILGGLKRSRRIRKVCLFFDKKKNTY